MKRRWKVLESSDRLRPHLFESDSHGFWKPLCGAYAARKDFLFVPLEKAKTDKCKNCLKLQRG